MLVLADELVDEGEGEFLDRAVVLDEVRGAEEQAAVSLKKGTDTFSGPADGKGVGPLFLSPFLFSFLWNALFFRVVAGSCPVYDHNILIAQHPGVVSGRQLRDRSGH